MPGEYTLKVEYAGFKTFSQPNISIETAAPSLSRSSRRGERGRHRAEVPLLQSSSTVGQFIERTTVANMPVAAAAAPRWCA
ncbi:MAG: hypothetical protein R2748_02930 [Bryobacterales bacterium]